MMRKRSTLFPVLWAGWFCFSVAGFALPAGAGERVTKTVEAEGEAVLGPHRTHDQTMRAAFDDARAKAVEQAAGVTVTRAQSLSQGIEWGHFLQTLSHGYVVKEDVIERPPPEFFRDPQKPTGDFIQRYRVKIRAEVVVPPPRKDPGFDVSATLNRETFQKGDKAELTINTNRLAWVYVVNLSADDRGTLLLPNAGQKDNRLEPGKPFRFPSPECGYGLEMEPAAGEDLSSEAFMVLAFPAPVGLEGVLRPGEPLSLPEFYRGLTQFGLENAAMKIVAYTVKAKGK